MISCVFSIFLKLTELAVILHPLGKSEKQCYKHIKYSIGRVMWCTGVVF